jgi:hypothetical protein
VKRLEVSFGDLKFPSRFAFRSGHNKTFILTETFNKSFYQKEKMMQ